MLTKKLTLGIMAALYGAGTAYATEPTNPYIYKPFGLKPLSQAVVPDWEKKNSEYTAWQNEGAVYNCSAWTPPENVVNLDEEFTQSRECSQSQSRTRTDEMYSQRLDQTRYEGPFGESRVITVEESQDSVGTRDYITGEREDAYPNWSKVGGFYGCGSWSPDPSEINYGATFTQERDCSWDEDRQRNVFNTWQSGRETYNRTDSEGRTVPYTDSRESTGTYRDWQPTSSTYTAWEDVGTDHSHTSWSPAPSTQPSDFTQSREYKRDQERYEQKREQDQVTDDYRNTGSPVLHEQTVDRSEDRDVTVDYTSWEEVNRSAYTSWSPAPTVQTASYNQTRNYTLTEERERSYTAAGDGELLTATESRDTVEQTESRPVTVTYTSWEETGTNYDCGTWAPARDTVGVDEAYTQTRSCKQDEVRDRVYTNESTELNRVEEGRTLTPTQSRAQTGEGSWVTHDSTFTSWENEGSRYGYTAWSPVSSNQKSDFTQSRDFKQNETRNEQERERDIHSGTIRNVGEPIKRDRTVSGEESRSVVVNLGSWSDTTRSAETSWSPAPSNQTTGFTQSMGYTQHQARTVVHNAPSEVHRFTDTQALVNQTDTRPVSVSFSEWSNSGAIKNCGGWSPAENTVAYNESYTQTRECDQDQVRNRSYRADGSVLNTFVENRTVKVNDTQNATGTGNWVAHASTFTSWINSGGRHTYSSYSPTPTTQTTTFSQSRSYKQNQTRNEQKRERDTIGGSIRNVGSPIARSQTINGSESRNVTVAWSSWSNSGGKYSCGAYNNPHGNQTASYTQTRVCKQNQTRTRTYSSGESFSESKVINSNDSRTVTVTVGGWSNTSTSGHSSWSPAASSQTSNYSQSRSYTQTQRRVWTHKVGSTTVHTRNEDRNLTGQTQSRSITVTNAAGAYGSNYGYGSWSPTPTSQTATFTQTRGYKRDRTRTYTHKSGTTTIHTRGVTETGNFSQSRNVTVSWSSWANSGAKYSCGAYNNPYGSQTASYTQTRVCKQNQTRTRTYSSGESFGESRTVNANDSRTVTVTVGGWSNTSTSAHTAWSPTAGSQTSNYSQSRSYTQTQRRVWTHKVGTSTVYTRNEDRNLTGQSQSRSITVTNAVGAYGSNHSYGSWTPAASAQTSNFSQTQSYKRNRTRTYTHKSGTTTIHTRSVTETSNFSQSRSVAVSWSTWVNNGTATCGGWSKDAKTGAKTRSCSQPEKRTRTYKVGTSTIHSATETKNRSYSETITVTGTTYGSWSGYSNQGSPYDCSASWSPAASTVESGTTFTQSRSCKQNQRRQRNKYTTYSDGSQDYVGLDYGTRIITVYQTRQATGTKITEECYTGGYEYRSDYGYENGDYCDIEYEIWRFNGVTIYKYNFDECRGGNRYEYSPGTFSGRDTYLYNGYKYTLKNVVNGYQGDVCRVPQ